MNLTDYSKTSMDRAFYAITNYAMEFGVSVADSEIVGLVLARLTRLQSILFL